VNAIVNNFCVNNFQEKIEIKRTEIPMLKKNRNYIKTFKSIQLYRFKKNS